MAVDDTWFKKDPDTGKRVKSAKHGRGRRYRVRYTDDAGKDRERLFDRKGDADDYDANVRADVSRGQYIAPELGRVVFEAYAEQWRENQVHRANTRAAVETHLRRHVYPRIGARPMRTVRPSDIQGMVRHWETALSPATIAVIYAYVAAVFHAAVRDRVIAVTPCVKIKRPKVESKRVAPMLTDAVNELREATPARWRVLDDLGAAAGLRQGEAFGLEVGHVQRAAIRVEQQILTLPGQPPFLAPPKSEKSKRTVPIGRVLAGRIEAHLKAFPPVEVEIVDRTGTKEIARTALLISTAADGTPLRRHSYNGSIWAPAVKAAGLEEEPTFHDLRHFYASVLISHGASVVQVQSRLGHATAAETLRTYSHLWPDEDDRTRNILDAVLSGKVVPLRLVS